MNQHQEEFPENDNDNNNDMDSELEDAYKNEQDIENQLEWQVWRYIVEGSINELEQLGQKMMIDWDMRLNEQGTTALIQAVLSSRIILVDWLIKQKKVNIDKCDIHGRSALIMACNSGDFEMVVYLLESGSQIDLQNNAGETALMKAVLKGHWSIVKVLVTNGANPLLQIGQKTCFELAKNLFGFEMQKQFFSFYMTQQFQFFDNQIKLIFPLETQKSPVRNTGK